MEIFHDNLLLLELTQLPHEKTLELMNEFDEAFPGFIITKEENVTWVDVQLNLRNVRKLIHLCLVFMNDPKRRSRKFADLFISSRIGFGDTVTQHFFGIYFESAADASVQNKKNLIQNMIIVLTIFEKTYVLSPLFKQQFNSYITFYDDVDMQDVFGQVRKMDTKFEDRRFADIVADANKFLAILKSEPTWELKLSIHPDVEKKRMYMNEVRPGGRTLEEHANRDFDSERKAALRKEEDDDDEEEEEDNTGTCIIA